MASKSSKQDLFIKERILEALNGFTVLRESRPVYSFEVQEGVVTFTGVVMTHAMRRMLLETTARIPGVVKVIDLLSEDDQIERELASVLVQSGLPLVWVKSYRGSVTLSGEVSSSEVKEQMLALAAEQHGVLNVIDNLAVPEQV